MRTEIEVGDGADRRHRALAWLATQLCWEGTLDDLRHGRSASESLGRAA